MGFFDINPTTALYMQMAGAATSAIGSFYSAKSQASSLKFQSDMAQVNARMAELGAQSEMLKGERQVGQLTLKAGQVKSAQRAAMAANGIDLGVGSAAEIQASTDLMKESDALTISANATRAAWANRMQGTNYQNEALMRRTAADGISPFASAATSLMGSAGSVAQNWYLMNKYNTPSNGG